MKAYSEEIYDSREVMSPDKRAKYINRKLRQNVCHAYEHASAIRWKQLRRGINLGRSFRTPFRARAG